MNDIDIRWIQRFENFKNAFYELEAAVTQRQGQGLSRLEAMGLIQAFEFTYELGWKVLKDFLGHKGFADLVGSRDTIREAVGAGVLDESAGKDWMGMLKDRNRTSHIYDEKTIRDIEKVVADKYYRRFKELVESLNE